MSNNSQPNQVSVILNQVSSFESEKSSFESENSGIKVLVWVIEFETPV